MARKKQANGQGSVRKHKTTGKWVASYPTGIFKDNGKRQYIYKYADSEAEGYKILDNLKEQKRKGMLECGKLKTGTWIDEWIEKVKAPGLAPATLISYRNNFRIHIKPYIGNIPLKELEAYQIQLCLDNINGSTSTFIKNYNIIHGAMKQAIIERKLDWNPCIGVRFPKDDAKKKKALSLAQQQRFIEELEGEYYRPMLLMYLYSGLRLGEGIPLTWEDIDLEKRTIRVNKKAIVCHDYDNHSAPQIVQDFCKSETSKRKVKITLGLVKVLEEHKAKMMERAEQLGEEWSESNFVFPNTRGNMVHNRNLQNSLSKIFAKCGIEGATMHTLRHSYATRCFEAKMPPKLISKQLGHQSVKTTLDIYVHVTAELEDEEIGKLDEINKLLV